MDAKTYWKKWADKCRSDLTTDIMPFWLKYGWDRKNGGVYTCVDRDGKLTEEWRTDHLVRIRLASEKFTEKTFTFTLTAE